MSPPVKKIKKRSSLKVVVDEADNGPSISSLPEEIVLNCLLHVPRSYYLNLSCVSKTMRSLVRSPELYRLRSLLDKDSVYVSFHEKGTASYHWFTLRPCEYRLVPVPIPFPSHSFIHQSSTVAVGSELFFVGGFFTPSSDLWILDTRSGKLTQGPSMKVARTDESAVGVINGKIYVIGGCEDKTQVEVFDPKCRNWKVAESPQERLQRCRLSASLDWSLYMVQMGQIAVYDSRDGTRMERLKMPGDTVWCMCVVDDVLYAYYFMYGLMWLDAKRKVWRKVVGDVSTSLTVYDSVTAEYDGKLAILWRDECGNDSTKKIIRCSMIALDCVGDKIRGTLEWSGIVATMPDSYRFHNCFTCLSFF